MLHIVWKALNRLDQAEIAALLTPPAGPCLSFFLPTVPADGHTTTAEPLLLRNLLDQATEQLVAQGMATPQIEQLLAPLTATAQSGELWRYQQKGLAFFVAPAVCLGYRLPLALPACVAIGQHFYIKPLVPIMDGEDNFYLLALSQNAVRLFHGDRYQMTAIALPDTPKSLAETLRYDEFERTLQLHSAGSGGQRRPPAIFHGQGVAGDETIVHANLLRFFHQVEQAVTSRLTRTHAPLVLAGVDADQGYYRQVNHYPRLLSVGIPGNYDRATPSTLHDLAWPVVAPYFAQAGDHALARYRQLAGQGDGHTVTEIKQVLLAAVYHQVDTIFVTSTGAIWGKFIPEGHQVVVHKEDEAGNEELINLAVIHTLQNHGTAYLLTPEQMPEPTPVAAILRH